MTLFEELTALMAEYRFKPNRRAAQNFMIDPETIQQIVKLASLTLSDTVLEIGPGVGFLTRELLKHSKVIAVESDELLCKILNSKFSEEIAEGKLILIEGNFLTSKIPKFNKVVSNVPYNISSDVVYSLLEKSFKLAVLTFQSEFADKLSALPGFMEYNAISVLTQHYTKLELPIQKIPAKVFFPKPSTFSTVVKINWKEKPLPIKDDAMFKLFVKEIFRLKNKNLSNSLSKAFKFLEKPLKILKAKFEKKLSELPNSDVKVYLLSPKEIAEIFNYLVG